MTINKSYEKIIIRSLKFLTV